MLGPYQASVTRHAPISAIAHGFTTPFTTEFHAEVCQ